MKRLLVLVLALSLCAGLCACGGSDTALSQEETEHPESATEPPATTEITEDVMVPEQAELPESADVPETTETPGPTESQEAGEELYEKSGITEEGITFTAYRRGGPDGIKVKLIYDTPDGLHYEEYYDPEGGMIYSVTTGADGSTYAIDYYPSGNMARTMTTMADGSYLEVHFLDNGYIDADGQLTSGEGYFQKEISADGQEKDASHYRGMAEDGTFWSTEQQEDGTVMRAHSRADGSMIEAYWHNLDLGRHVTELYYENGVKKSSETRYDRRKEYVLEEYDEEGALQHRIVIREDGTEQEAMFGQSGFCTYLRIKGLEDTTEYFADENGNLETYVYNGSASKGDAISAEVRQNWNAIKAKLPADVS